MAFDPVYGGGGGFDSGANVFDPGGGGFDVGTIPRRKKHHFWDPRDWIVRIASPFGLPLWAADELTPSYLDPVFQVPRGILSAGVSSLMHPGATAEGGYNTLRGLGEIPKLLEAFIEDPAMTGKTVGESIWEDYKRRYSGDDLDDDLKSDPLSFLFDALAVVAPAVRAGALASSGARLGKAGIALGGSRNPWRTNIWREMAQPGLISEGVPRMNTLRYTPEGGETLVGEFPMSRSPFRRGLQQVNIALAEAAPNAPMFGAAARYARNEARNATRLDQRLLGTPEHVDSLERLGEAGRNRLFWSAQIGEHSDEALQSFRDVLARELRPNSDPTELDEITTPEFAQWIRDAKKEAFGGEILKDLDEAIKFDTKPGTKQGDRYRRAVRAMEDMTEIVEDVIADANGFKSLANDVERAKDRLEGMAPGTEAYAAAAAELADLERQLARKGDDLREMFGDRRNLVRDFWRANYYVDTPERNAWNLALFDRFSPEEARGIRKYLDAYAGASDDPVARWRDVIGMPTGEKAEEFMDRMAAEAGIAHYQGQGVRATSRFAKPEARRRRPERVAHTDTHQRLIKELEDAEREWDEAKRKPEKTKAGKPIKKNKDLRAKAEARLSQAREAELWGRIFYGSKAFADGPNFKRTPVRAKLMQQLWEHRSDRNGAMPPGVNGPEDLERLMDIVEELAQKGKAGRFWYRDSGEAILKLAGGNKDVAAKVAQLIAIYSPQKAVVPNFGEAVKAYNSWKFGLPIDNGMGWQKRKAQEVLDGTGNWEGRKTNNFYRNLLQHIDHKRFVEEGFTGDEVTSDMWMARVFGYMRTKLTEGRYDVIEDITQRLAQELGWEPQEVQAAVWTAVKELSDDVSANTDFAGAIERHIGGINYEGAPGATLPDDHWFKREWERWDADTKVAYTRGLGRLTDNFMRDAGLLHLPSQRGPGVYLGDVSPGMVVRTVTSGAAREPAATHRARYAVSEAERPMLNFVAASIGRAGLQDSVPWLRGFKPTTRGHADVLGVRMGRRATEAEAKKIYDRLNGPIESWEDERVWVVHSGAEGILIRKNPFHRDADNWPNLGKGKQKGFQQEAEEAIDAILGTDNHLVHAVADGELIENDWRQGDADYTKAIEGALGDGRGHPESVRLRGAADRFAVQAEALRQLFRKDPRGVTERFYGRGDGGVAQYQPGTGRAAHELGYIEDEPLPRGASEYLGSGRSRMHAFEEADPSTFAHELGHAIYHDLTAAEKKVINDFVAEGRDWEDWTVPEQEHFASMHERWVAEGDAPTRALRRVFGHMSQMMEAVVRLSEKGEPLPDEIRKIFKRAYRYGDNDVNIFIPHRAYSPNLASARTSKGIPRAQQTIGSEAKARFPMFKENKLALLKSGLLNTDPRHLMEYMDQVVALARANQLREVVMEMGHKLMPDDPPPDFSKVYVVKKAGTGVDRKVFQAMEASDEPDEMRAAIKNYVDDQIMSTDMEYQDALRQAKEAGHDLWKGEHQLYVVDKRAVDLLFKNVTGKTPGATTKSGRSTLGIAGDAMLDSARAFLLYANPGFYLSNILGNAFMLTVNDPRAWKYFRWSMKNSFKAGSPGEDLADPLWDRVSIESGRGPLTGSLSQGASQRALGASRGVGTARGAIEGAGEKLSYNYGRYGRKAGRIIDDTFRVATWRQAAAKRGYRSDAQVKKLLDDAYEAPEGRGKFGKLGTRARRDLAGIRDEAENMMLDFDSLTPFEKTYLQRLIFLYPFVRASAKYPFMYAAEHPFAAAVLGQTGTQVNQAAVDLYGQRPDLPAWAAGWAQAPNFLGGGYIPFGNISPYGMPSDLLESIASIGQPGEVGVQRPWGYINPLMQLGMEMAMSKDKWGEDANALQILAQDFPAPSYIGAMLGRKPSAIYSDRSRMAALMRALRVVPFGVDSGYGVPAATPSRTSQANPLASALADW